MSVKRIVDTQFWNDDKVVENFSPEDKLFMLYLMTNPHTTQLGIYSISKKVMGFELGYSLDTIGVLIERFENKYQIIRYSNETKEIAIKNYLKYSIVKGGKPVEDLLTKEINLVKDKSLIQYVYNNIIDYTNLNETVKLILTNYNDNYNDNDNDVSLYDTSHDTSHDTSPDYEKEFEELWKQYPKKEGKKDALKHYIVARKNKTTYEQVENGIKRFNEAIKFYQTEYRYIPMGSSWFHQEKWNDEYKLEKRIGRKNNNVFAELLEEEENGKETNIIDANYVESIIS